MWKSALSISIFPPPAFGCAFRAAACLLEFPNWLRTPPGWSSPGSSACGCGCTSAASPALRPWLHGWLQSAAPCSHSTFSEPNSVSRAGVVPAVALAAHRSRNAVLVQQLREVLAGILAATVAMKQQLALARAGAAARPSPARRSPGCAACAAAAPAHYAAAEQVDHHGQK